MPESEKIEKNNQDRPIDELVNQTISNKVWSFVSKNTFKKVMLAGVVLFVVGFIVSLLVVNSTNSGSGSSAARFNWSKISKPKTPATAICGDNSNTKNIGQVEYDIATLSSACNNTFGQNAWGIISFGDSSSGCWKRLCCGDDSQEYYKILKFENEAPYPNSYACCSDDSDCVSPINQCVNNNQLTKSSADLCYNKELYRCMGGMAKNDIRQIGNYLCNYGITGVYGWSPVCGDNSIRGFEYDFNSSLCEMSFGEDAWNLFYGSSNTPNCWQGKCCGDDKNEHVVQNKVEGELNNFWACCDSQNDCAREVSSSISDSNCFDSHTSFLDIELCIDGDWQKCEQEGEVIDNYQCKNGSWTETTDTYCGQNETNGIDYDNNQHQCQSGFGASAWQLGYGNSTSPCWQKTCCGDDARENFIQYQQAENFYGHITKKDEWACCQNATDCITDNICHQQGETQNQENKILCVDQAWRTCYAAGWEIGGYICDKNLNWLKKEDVCGKNALTHGVEGDANKEVCQNNVNKNPAYSWGLTAGNSNSGCWKNNMCCGDDSGEYTNQYTREDGTTADYWACCDKSDSCVSADKICYSHNEPFGTVNLCISGQWHACKYENEKEIFGNYVCQNGEWIKVCGQNEQTFGTEYDHPDSQLYCENMIGDHAWNLKNGDSGSSCWKNMCCGDDAREYYRQYTREDNTTADYWACCNDSNSCVTNGSQCSPYIHGNYYCSNSKWIECNQEGKTINDYICHNKQWQKKDSVVCGNDYYDGTDYDTGETKCESKFGSQAWGLNYGSSSSSCWRGLCCGDDSKEYYRQYTREDNTTADYWACCDNETDCVASNSNCYLSNSKMGTTYVCHQHRWHKCDTENKIVSSFICQGGVWKDYNPDAPIKCGNLTVGCSGNTPYCRQYTREDNTTADYWACCDSSTDCVSSSSICYNANSTMSSYYCDNLGRWKKQ